MRRHSARPPARRAAGTSRRRRRSRAAVQRGRPSAGAAERPDDLFGDVHQSERVDAGLDAVLLAHRGEDLGGAVAGAGAELRPCAVEVARPSSYAAIEFATASERFWCACTPRATSSPPTSSATRARTSLDGQRSGRVGDVDGVGAERLQQPGLREQSLRRVHVAHHQEADGLHAEVLRHPMCCSVMSASVQCTAMRATLTPRSRTGPEVVDRADARASGGTRSARSSSPARPGLDQLHLVDGAEAVVERRSAEAVAVRDLDHLARRRRRGPSRWRTTCRRVYWCETACDPSRSVESMSRKSRARLRRGGGHAAPPVGGDWPRRRGRRRRS